MKLKTEGLYKKYRNRMVVKDVWVEVNQGEIVGLLGPNGAGKTTTFYIITGLIKPFAGKVFLDDTDITGLPMYKRAQMGIGYLAQEASVFRNLSVEDNIKAVLEFSKFNKAEQKERLEALLKDFGLEKIRKSKGIQLSGGERRRTEIARALAVDPKFILLDEPFAGIDPIAVEDLQGIVAQLKHRNIGVLITDHNVRETLDIVRAKLRAGRGTELDVARAEAFGAEILELSVEVGGTITGEHGVGVEKINQMCKQFGAETLEAFFAVKRAFDPAQILNRGKAIPTLARCAEYGRMHVHRGQLRFPELPRF